MFCNIMFVRFRELHTNVLRHADNRPKRLWDHQRETVELFCERLAAAYWRPSNDNKWTIKSCICACLDYPTNKPVTFLLLVCVCVDQTAHRWAPPHGATACRATGGATASAGPTRRVVATPPAPSQETRVWRVFQTLRVKCLLLNAQSAVRMCALVSKLSSAFTFFVCFFCHTFQTNEWHPSISVAERFEEWMFVNVSYD